MATRHATISNRWLSNLGAAAVGLLLAATSVYAVAGHRGVAGADPSRCKPHGHLTCPPTTPPLSTTPPPSSSPPPTTLRAACPNPRNTPGGADPFGTCFPGASNTGVRRGTTLTTYTGSLRLRCGTVINSKRVNGNVTVAGYNGTTSPATPCVTIRNSRINGVVLAGDQPGRTGPLVMTDVEVNAPTNSVRSSVVGTNFYLWRVNVHNGAQAAIQCAGYCAVRDSWTHDLYRSGAAHYDGILSNGTAGHPLVVDHDSVGCFFYASAHGASGACSADIGLFGDFSAISHVTVTRTLLLPSTPVNGPSVGYCLYGGSEAAKRYPTATYVVATNNVFKRGGSGKCGDYGPVAYWRYNAGDVWRGNVWSDGTRLNP
jgi:hypothetical protein